MRTAVPLATLAFALTACNPSIVQPDDALYQETVAAGEAVPEEAGAATPRGAAPGAFNLALPLSGPHFRHANVFGLGTKLSTGTRVYVDRIERGGVTGDIPPQWYQWYPQAVAYIRRVYRIYFHTDAGACAEGCMAHWRAADDADFEERFSKIFVTRDPLAGLDEDTRALVEAHKVAGWFDAETVRLAIGAPNAIVDTAGSSRWVFETRYCQGALLVAEPSLELEFEGDQVQTFERLSPADFYYPLEPLDPQAGLCGYGYPLGYLSWNGAFVPDRNGFERRMAPDRPALRYIDTLGFFADSIWLQRPSAGFAQAQTRDGLLAQ